MRAPWTTRIYVLILSFVTGQIVMSSLINNRQIMWGLCTPASCTGKDVADNFNTMLALLGPIDRTNVTLGVVPITSVTTASKKPHFLTGTLICMWVKISWLKFPTFYFTFLQSCSVHVGNCNIGCNNYWCCKSRIHGEAIPLQVFGVLLIAWKHQEAFKNRP